MTKRQTYKTKLVFKDLCVPKITLLERFLLHFHKKRKCLEVHFNKDDKKVFIYKKMMGNYYFIKEEL